MSFLNILDSALLISIGMSLSILLHWLLYLFKKINNNIKTTVKESDQRKLLNSNNIYRSIFDCAFDVIFTFDRHFKIISVSPSVERMLGYKPSDIEGKYFPELSILAPEYFETVFCNISRLFAGDSIQPSVYEFIAKRGNRKIAEVSGAPLYQNNEIFGVISVARDITEKTKYEQNLIAETSQNLKVYNNIPMPIIIINAETFEVLFANDALFKLYNKNPIGGFCYEQLHGLQSQCSSCKIGDFINSNEIVTETEYYLPIVRRNYRIIAQKIIFRGSPIIIHNKSIPDKNASVHMFGTEPYSNYAIKAIFIIFFSLNEAKNSNKDQLYHQMQTDPIKQAEALELLSGGLAHDINNMIHVILCNSDVAMQKSTLDISLYETIEEIKAAAQKSASMVHQLLDLGSRKKIESKLVNVNENIEAIMKVLKRLIDDNKIKLFWKPGIQQWFVNINPVYLDQILINLLINARDSIMDYGQVTIETGAAVFDKGYCDENPFCYPGMYVMLSVKDSGIGIDQSIMNKIFDPYFTTKIAGKGYGLGLSTIYRIVRLNNGFINVNSEPSKGTTFKIYLPRFIQELKS